MRWENFTEMAKAFGTKWCDVGARKASEGFRASSPELYFVGSEEPLEDFYFLLSRDFKK